MAVAAMLAMIVSIMRLTVMAWLGETGRAEMAEAVGRANIWLFILPTLGLTYWLGKKCCACSKSAVPAWNNPS